MSDAAPQPHPPHEPDAQTAGGGAVEAGGENPHGSQRVVIAALCVNVAIALCKFFVAWLSRSTSMLAEALHSLADSANQVFLLLGMRLSARPPDDKHPFGYASETYFWSFIVALCIFAVGGAVSILEGVQKMLHLGENHIGHVYWAYGVLGASIVLELYSLSIAMREFKHIRRGRSVLRTIDETRDPTVLTVLFEDLAALFGLVVAFAGVLLTHLTGMAVFDGLASIIVGVALVTVAGVLGRDAKSLLIGKSVPAVEREQILKIAGEARDVLKIVHVRTIHFGPQEVMCGLKLSFNPDLDLHTLELRINELERSLRAALPHLKRIYVEPGFDERDAPKDAA